jgi:hypothetical protein
MKKKYTVTFVFLLLLAACGGGNDLNKQEQKAVETQVQKDQKAMDSLEKVIKAQINQTDSVKN